VQRDGPYSVISSSGPKSTHVEFKVNGPGVIIGRKGSLGTVYYSEENFWPHDTTLWIKNFHGNDPRFAYYFLQTMGFERLDAGASNPTLNRNHIHTIPVLWPPAPIQRRIARILSAYDDLIENSQRRIKILESMARALYREWFVHFRFPGHENHPRVASPLGEIPEGWEVKRLGDLFDFVGGSQPPKIEHIHEERPGYVRFIQNRDYGSSSHVTYIAESRRNKYCDRLDIMVDKYGEPGRTRFGLAGAYNVALANLLPIASHQREWLRGLISEPDFNAYLAGASMAATRASLNSSHFNVPVAVPSNEVARSFGEHVEPMLRSVLTHQDSIDNLRRTRDLLLPRLLSGQIALDELEAA
jgi:type I restriction enzyme S subunit